MKQFLTDLAIRFLHPELARHFAPAPVEPAVEETHVRQVKRVISSELIQVKKGKLRYMLLILQTRKGKLRFNLGRKLAFDNYHIMEGQLP